MPGFVPLTNRSSNYQAETLHWATLPLQFLIFCILSIHLKKSILIAGNIFSNILWNPSESRFYDVVNVQKDVADYCLRQGGANNSKGVSC